MLACFAGQLDAVQILRENGALYDIRDRGGSTAMHWACDSGNSRLIDWMIKDGCDVNAKDRTAGWTPLLRVGECLLKVFNFFPAIFCSQTILTMGILCFYIL